VVIAMSKTKHEREIRKLQRQQAQLLAEREAERRAAVEAKAAARRQVKALRRWKDQQCGSFGAASAVRHIDPKTGEPSNGGRCGDE
jgi:hypothetical protein